MSDSTQQQLAPPSKDSTSTTSTRLRSFRKKSAPSAAVSPSEASSTQSKTSSKRNGSRIGRLLKRGSRNEFEEEGEGEAEKTGSKRRQQIYQAQKRHRNRRAEYVKSLEDEVAKLRNMDSAVRHEKSSLSNQNRMMRELLASHSIDAQFASVSLAPSTASEGLADFDMLDLATVDVRFDPDVGQERAFIDWSGSEGMAGSNGTSASPDPSPKPAMTGDSWAAVDFILALEWPCRGHLLHDGINPNVTPHVQCEMGLFTGHALTATAAVFESALPPPVHLHRNGENGHANGSVAAGTEKKWLLPHSEIEKLVKLSDDLPLDDERITPAQAYSAIRQNVDADEDLKAILEALKVPLACIVECAGYGAVLPADQFWQHLNTAMTSLKS